MNVNRYLTPKRADKLQHTVRGFSNRHRIRILFTLENRPGLSLQDLADITKVNFRTAGEHTRRLKNAGLINKKYNNREVEHRLTPLGKKVASLLHRLNKEI